MRLRIGQNAQSVLYPALSNEELSSDSELLTNYRRTKGYNRVLVAVASFFVIRLVWNSFSDR